MKKIILLLYTIALLLIFSTKVIAQSTGTLTFTYTPIAHGTGNYALAIWIDNGSVSGFTRTINRFCDATTYNHLPTWAGAAWCGFSGTPLVQDATSVGCRTIGAILGGNLLNYSTRTIIWDGINQYSVLASDSTCRVVIEETWGSGTNQTAIRYFTFTKGPNVDDQTTGIPNDANYKDISLIWQPTLTTESFAAATATVFPNPSNTGVFNLAVKDSVTAVKVYSILGATLSNETVSLSNGDTKTLDLSSYNNGLYIVSVTNNKGTANYKVVLDK